MQIVRHIADHRRGSVRNSVASCSRSVMVYEWLTRCAVPVGDSMRLQLGIWPSVMGMRRKTADLPDGRSTFNSSQRTKSATQGVAPMNLMARFLREESAATAAEYALILGIVGAAIAVGAYVLGGTIGSEMNQAAGCV